MRKEATEEDIGQENMKIAKFLALPLVRELRHEVAAQYAVRHPSKPELDIAFGTSREGYGQKEVSLFGMEKCVGIKIVETDQEAAILKSTHPEKYEHVAVITISDLEKWREFYEELWGSGTWGRVGKKSLDTSGLERIQYGDVVDIRHKAERFLSRAGEHLKKHGVEHISNVPDGSLGFFDKDWKSVEVPFFNTRTYQIRGGVLAKEINREVRMISKLRLPYAGENEREVMERVGGNTLTINRGQIDLWMKLGYENALRPSIDGVTVDMYELIDFLYSNGGTRDGILASTPHELSLPEVRSGESIDLLFWQREGDGSRKQVGLDNVVGLDLRKYKRGETGFITVSNIGGILLFPDDWTVEQMHKHAKSVIRSMNRTSWNEDRMLLYLNTQLFEEWKRTGTIFSTTASDVFDTEPQRRVEYGYGVGPVKSVRFVYPWRGPKVGDAQGFLEIDGPDTRQIFGVDAGDIYQGVSAAEKSLTEDASVTAGLRSGMERGSIPMVPGTLYWPYLVYTALNWDMTGNDAPARFTRASLAYFEQQSNLSRLIGPDRARQIIDQGGRDRGEFFDGRHVVYSGTLLTHAHIDHVGGVGVLGGEEDPEARANRIICLWEVTAYLLHLSNKKNWLKDPAYLSRPDLPKKKGYEGNYRDIHAVVHPEKPVQLSPGVEAIFYPVDHSMEAAAIGIRTPRGSVFYSGDIKAGPNTDASMERVGRDGYDKYIWEATNQPPENVGKKKSLDKPSARITSEKVRDSIIRALEPRDGKLKLVMATPNNPGRMELLKEVSDVLGLRMLAGYEYVDIVKHMQAQMRGIPVDAHGIDKWLPELGIDVGLYAKSLSSKTWQGDIDAFMRRNNLEAVDFIGLGKNAGDILLVLSPYDNLRRVIGGARVEGLSVVYSAPFPYGMRDKQNLAAMQRFVREKGGKFFADFEVLGDGGAVNIFSDPENGFHTSGHATFMESMGYLEIALGDNPVGKEVYFVHGSHTELVARKAAEYFGIRGMGPDQVKFFGSHPNYNLNNPMIQRGLVVELN